MFWESLRNLRVGREDLKGWEKKFIMHSKKNVDLPVGRFDTKALLHFEH